MLKPGEIIPLTDDDMFTEVFNNKDNICILEEFISTYFNYSLDKVRGNLIILPRRLNKNRAKEKSKEVDLLLKYNNKNYNIEMSTGWNQSIIDRNVIYLSNIHGRQLDKGDNYYLIDESIQLNLCAFKNKDKKRQKYYLTCEDGDILTTKLRLDIVYMENLKNMCYTENEEINALITWCKVFECKTKKELENIVEKILSKKSKEQLISDVSRLSGDKDMVKKYEGKTKWESERDCMLYGFEQQRKSFDEERKNLDEEKKKLEDEKQNFEDEKQNFEDEKQSLEDEKQSFEDEKRRLKNEKEILIKELIKLNIPNEEIVKKMNVSIDYVNEAKSNS